MEFEMEEIFKELDEIFGTTKCKEVVKNYANYIQMKQLNQISFGNYNVLIRNLSEYDSYEKLINVIWKILTINGVINTKYKYLEERDLRKDRSQDGFQKIKKLEEDLLIIDTKKMDIYFGDNMRRNVKEMIESIPNKVFIIVDEDRVKGQICANLGNCITWTFEVEKITKENKEKYIKNFLKENEIKFDEKSLILNGLSNEPFWKVKEELFNIILECKIKKVKMLNDEVFKTKLKKNYFSKTKITPKLKNGKKELEKLIGIESVKEQVEGILEYIKVNKNRKNMPALHMCFMGNPGTGKTTVARIFGKIFEEEKILSDNGKFVEIHGRDLIAKYVGWTAQLTKEKVNEAEGGILFIDEAYSLNSDRRGSFEDEAIATLLKEMEDKRDNLCVIIAGYKEEMKELIARNPGFESRIQFKINFPDYTEEELYEIFKLMAKEEKYKIATNLKETLKDYFKIEKRKINFSNARCVRNLFEKVKFEQAHRVSNNKGEDINLIKKCDVENAIIKVAKVELAEETTKNQFKIGFAS